MGDSPLFKGARRALIPNGRGKFIISTHSRKSAKNMGTSRASSAAKKKASIPPLTGVSNYLRNQQHNWIVLRRRFFPATWHFACMIPSAFRWI